jgi:hypothetical protein
MMAMCMPDTVACRAAPGNAGFPAPCPSLGRDRFLGGRLDPGPAETDGGAFGRLCIDAADGDDHLADLAVSAGRNWADAGFPAAAHPSHAMQTAAGDGRRRT